AAALNDESLNNLNAHALNLGLEILFEVHNEEEMARVLKLNPKLVGINNRDLKTFTVDLTTTEKLKNIVKDSNVFLISEIVIESSKKVKDYTHSETENILICESY